MVPKGWTRKTLESVVSDERYSIVDGPFGSNLKSEHYRTSGIPVLQSGFVTSGTFIAKEYVYVDEQLFNEQRRSSAIGGDILMAKIGAQAGRCALIPENHPVSIIAGNCLKLTFNRCCQCAEYYWYVLTDHYDRSGLKEIRTETAQPAISLKSLKSFQVLVPPLPEQRKIAQILSTWDKAIATTERLLVNKQQQKKALMQRLLTGKQRFAGFEGEWQNLTLAEVAQITMGSSPLSTAYNDSGDGLPLIQGNADIKDRLSAPRIHTSQITKECFSDDVLLSVRAPVGTVAKSRHHACIGRGIAAIRAKGLLSQEYLYQLLLDFEPKWERLSQGSTFESVNSDDIKSLPVRLPCIKEQQKIASVLLATDTEITTIQSQLDNLKLQKKALMQQLLTGKRRVKVDSPDSATLV